MNIETNVNDTSLKGLTFSPESKFALAYSVAYALQGSRSMVLPRDLLLGITEEPNEIIDHLKSVRGVRVDRKKLNAFLVIGQKRLSEDDKDLLRKFPIVPGYKIPVTSLTAEHLRIAACFTTFRGDKQIRPLDLWRGFLVTSDNAVDNTVRIMAKLILLEDPKFKTEIDYVEAVSKRPDFQLTLDSVLLDANIRIVDVYRHHILEDMLDLHQLRYGSPKILSDEARKVIKLGKEHGKRRDGIFDSRDLMVGLLEEGSLTPVFSKLKINKSLYENYYGDNHQEDIHIYHPDLNEALDLACAEVLSDPHDRVTPFHFLKALVLQCYKIDDKPNWAIRILEESGIDRLALLREVISFEYSDPGLKYARVAEEYRLKLLGSQHDASDDTFLKEVYLNNMVQKVGLWEKQASKHI